MSEIQLPPHLSRPPTGPLEILMPEERPPLEPPRLAGRLISLLVFSKIDTHTIAFHGDGRYAKTSDERVQQFLNDLAERGELGTLISHCRSILFPAKEPGALGWLGAIQQEWSYHFMIIEQAALPPKWEIIRKVVSVQQDTSA